MFREDVYTLLRERGYPIKDAQIDAYGHDGVWLSTQVTSDRLRLSFDKGYEYLVPIVADTLAKEGYRSEYGHLNFDVLFVFNKEV